MPCVRLRPSPILTSLGSSAIACAPHRRPATYHLSYKWPSAKSEAAQVSTMTGEGTMQLATIDVVVVAAYLVFIFGLAQFVSRDRAGHAKNTTDYFLASKNLPWWAIGASLIAANISAEQIVGM